MKVTKIITFIAKEDSTLALQELLGGMVEPSRAEKGCLKYELYQKADAENIFVILESWEDKHCLESHKSTPHFKHFKEHIEAFINAKSSETLRHLK